ncbi:MAG TPA: DNA polymerase III subunit alpha [Spirochaetota bacterium]|nr:DNA polymerase III subunit alpha [Spirochaetota bacterium]
MSFVHLHVHTDYSALDGAIKVDELISSAVKYKMKAVAVTDHGNMACAIDFYQKAVDAGIKPIIGQEFYIAPKSRFEKTKSEDEDTAYHLILLAENYEGYRNLMELSSIGYTEGYYYKPRIDRECLERFSKNLICASACIGGEIPQFILQNKKEEAKKTALYYKELFGPRRFYLELQDHGLKEQKIVNRELAILSKELDIPLIATNDCHYLNREDSFAHEVLLCVQTGKTISDERRMRFDTEEFYFKTSEEMASLFSEYPDSIYNTGKIAEMINIELPLDKPVLPVFEVPAGHTLNSYMKEIVDKGAHKKFGENIPDNVRERIDYELSVIFKMDFAGYFLIVWDFINHSREVGIPVGPGRGSAAGSIVSYCMGITQLNPLDYNLLFERFLNPDRKEMPDMDIDFCAERREEVIQYVKNKYGEDHVSQIITYNTMAPKAAVKDVARVLDVPFNAANAITKMITEKTLNDSIQASKDLQKFIKENEENKKIIDISLRLEGLLRSFGKHAAGIVISKEPLTHYVPLYKDPKEGSIISQYDKIFAESAGLVKMDFLGLKNLTVIESAVNLVRKYKDKNFDIESIAIDDKETFELLRKAETDGVFQLESPGMQNLLRRLGPTEFEDIIACGALYRPGPLKSGMADQYVQRKHNASLVKYEHPVLEPVLKDTLGVIIYQEQVMKISQVMGGFTMGEADKLRKAMGRKKMEIVNEMRDKFLKGAEEKKISANIAEEIYDAMSKFAQYGFNKSHAAAYGLVTYQTAYLKAHYRTEYMCALLSVYIGDQDDVKKYLTDCRAGGIEILPPDVNKSYYGFSIEGDKKIRFGLNAVKGMGEKAIQEIIAAREANGEFKTLRDFLENVALSALNKGTLEALVKSGAFSSIEPNRAKLYTSIDRMTDAAKRFQNEKKSGQANLFGSASVDIELPKMTDFPDSLKLTYEKETLGLYISGHPLEKYEREIRAFSSCSTAKLEEKTESVSLVGLIENAQKRISKKGKTYVTALLEDLDGAVEIFIFEKVLKKYEEIIFSNEVVMVSGKIDAEDEVKRKIIVDDIIPLKQARAKAISAVHVSIDPIFVDDEILEKIRSAIENNRGNCPVYFHVANQYIPEKIVRANGFYNINPTDSLLNTLSECLGDDCVRFSFKGCA